MYPKGNFFDMNIYFMLNLTRILNNLTILRKKNIVYSVKSFLCDYSNVWDILVILKFNKKQTKTKKVQVVEN